MTDKVEDTKRLRTKIRLDLNDVRIQIEELEEIVKRDKSKESKETLQKLIEYEQKLKDQYEKMTGITLDQARQLIQTRDFEGDIPRFPNFLGLLAGLLFGWGFYNALLQGIVGFGPINVLDYFTDVDKDVATPLVLIGGLTYTSSNQLIIYPIAASLLLFFLRGILSKRRWRLIEFMDSISFIAVGAFFVYLIEFPDTNEDVVEAFEDNMQILGLILLGAGFLIFLSSFDVQGIFSKLLKMLSGGLIISSSVQFLLITLDDNLAVDMKVLWPWLIGPLVLAGFITSLFEFVQLRK